MANLKLYLTAYGTTAVAFLVIDAIWLSNAARLLYRPYIGEILLPSGFNLAPAAIFYLIYVGGMCYFAVIPAMQSGNWTTALVNGAVLGFVAYATYDLTNQATLRQWSTVVTVADLAWGTFVTATSATLGFLATRFILRS